MFVAVPLLKENWYNEACWQSLSIMQTKLHGAYLDAPIAGFSLLNEEIIMRERLNEVTEPML